MRLLVVISILLAVILQPETVRGIPLRCPLPSADTVLAELPGALGLPQYRNASLMQALAALQGPDFSYPDRDYVALDWPKDVAIEATFTFFPDRQWVEFWHSPTQPASMYVFVYPTPEKAIGCVHTPLTGDHCGKHPVCGMRVPTSEARLVYTYVQRDYARLR